MADFPVLAENAPEIAVGEKNCPGPSFSDQRSFLSKMGMGAEDDCLERSLTEALFPFPTIHATFPGAKFAVFQNGISLFHPLFELFLSFQLHIRGNPGVDLVFDYLLGRGGSRTQGISGSGRQEQGSAEEQRFL
jgi:hypothetical protein